MMVEMLRVKQDKKADAQAWRDAATQRHLSRHYKEIEGAIESHLDAYGVIGANDIIWLLFRRNMPIIALLRGESGRLASALRGNGT